MLRKRGRAVEFATIDEGRFDRGPGAKLREKRPSLLVQAFDLDASQAAFDQYVARAAVKIHLAERVIVGIQNRPPYDVRRVSQPQ